MHTKWFFAARAALLGGLVLPVTGCMNAPGSAIAGHRYEYMIYRLQGAGTILDGDVKNWNINGALGWRIVNVVDDRYLILEREW